MMAVSLKNNSSITVFRDCQNMPLLSTIKRDHVVKHVWCLFVLEQPVKDLLLARRGLAIKRIGLCCSLWKLEAASFQRSCWASVMIPWFRKLRSPYSYATYCVMIRIKQLGLMLMENLQKNPLDGTKDKPYDDPIILKMYMIMTIWPHCGSVKGNNKDTWK